MSKPVELDPDVPFLDLDLADVGDVLVRLVLTARRLGHKRPQCTANDYYHHPQTPAMRFLHDVFTKETAEICDLWFGGDDNARRFTQTLIPVHD